MTLKGQISLCLAAFFLALAGQIFLSFYQSGTVLRELDDQMGNFNAISRFQNGVERSLSAMEDYRWEYGDAKALTEELHSAFSVTNAWLWRIESDLGTVSEEQYLLYNAVSTTYDSYTALVDQLEEAVAAGQDTKAAQLYYNKIVPCGGYLRQYTQQLLNTAITDAQETYTTVSALSDRVKWAQTVVVALCLALAANMLEMLHTKDDLLPGAVLYFRIYALGMPALGIFNFGNAVLSASGDTKRPLAYLTAAGILNVILNLFFVIVCKMAADGVALASVISQYLSAVLILIHMVRLQDSCRVEGKRLRLHGGEAGRILGLGIPAGIQHMIFAVANLFIQVGINSFDSTVVSGNSAAVNVDNVIYNVMAAFYTACSTFMGQNWGAGNKDRMMKSYYISLGYSFLIAAVLGVGFLLCGEPFLYIFTNDADVVAAGMERMQIMCFSYCISAFMDCTIAACRGIGRSFVPTIIVILGSCVFRVVWVYTLFAHFHTIPSLYLLYPFSWILTAAAEILYFIRCCRRLRIAQA